MLRFETVDDGSGDYLRALLGRDGGDVGVHIGVFYYLATIGAIEVGDRVKHHHGALGVFWLVLFATYPAVLAAGQAARWCIRRQRQADDPRSSYDPSFWPSI